MAGSISNMDGYFPITDYGFIGDMHTCALISKTGSLDFMCWPVFDSPSVFCRILDKDKGGYFSIRPELENEVTCKQKYLPYTNMLQTKWFHAQGSVEVLDYFPLSNKPPAPNEETWLSGWCPCRYRKGYDPHSPICHSGIIRKISCSSGSMDMVVELFPAFNYARDGHIISGGFEKNIAGTTSHKLIFKSDTGQLVLEICLAGQDGESQIELQEKAGLKGHGLWAKLKMSEEQSATFILHSEETTLPENDMGQYISKLEQETFDFWTNWARICKFTGHYREQVVRSLLVLKLLTYMPTGAIIASPTFSLPECIGGARNWDYRYSWIRDTSFTLYVFLENGYDEEAEAYMDFIYNRIIPSITREAAEAGQEQILPIVISISGDLEIPEMELKHLDGYRGSRPVRIGNGATSHTQLDTVGALLDSLYLYNKYVGPISYERWMQIRRIVDYVLELRHLPDMSIWEVRGQKQNFVFSKIMIWVMVDRALRLSDKRSNLPCPDYPRWRSVRDHLYEEIMEKGYNSDAGHFGMSYERSDVLDASVLIAPLVLFIAPDDPRMLGTIRAISKSRAQGGLSSGTMVYRYDYEKVQDGVWLLLISTF